MLYYFVIVKKNKQKLTLNLSTEHELKFTIRKKKENIFQ